METPDHSIDFNDAYIEKVTQVINQTCFSHGFSNTQIDLSPDIGIGALFIEVYLAPSLPRFRINIFDNGNVNFNIESLDFEENWDNVEIDTTTMSKHLDYLTFCQSMAQQIERDCHIDMAVSDTDPESGIMWQSPERRVLNEEGGVEDVTYVRQVVGAIVDSIRSREC